MFSASETQDITEVSEKTSPKSSKPSPKRTCRWRSTASLS
jgi:hypothetical protein